MFKRIPRETVPPARVEATGAIALAREALARGVPVRMRVFGASMTPTLLNGASIEIQPLFGAPLRRGEVVAWARGDRLVVHRVVRVQADGRVVTRGDASGVSDPPCRAEELLGRVALPGNGRLRGLSLRRRFRRRLSRAIRALGVF